MKQRVVCWFFLLGACGGDAAPGGRDVGLRAVVIVDGQELESNELELVVDGTAAPEMQRATLSQTLTGFDAGQDSLDGIGEAWQSRLVKLKSAGPRALTADCPTGIAPGQTVTSVPTRNGVLCWASFSVAMGQLGTELQMTMQVLFGRDGIYMTGGPSENVGYPPAFVSVSALTGYGCYRAGAAEATQEVIHGLKPLTLSLSLGPFQFGFSMFALEGQGVVPAFELSYGVGADISIVPLPIGVSVQVASQSVPIRALRGYTSQCLVARSSLTADTSTPWAGIARDLALVGDGGDPYQAALAKTLAQNFLPSVEILGASTGQRAGNDRPAGSTADLFAGFAETEGALCESCPETSADGLVFRLSRALAESEGPLEFFAEGAPLVARGTQSMPDSDMLAAARAPALGGVDLVVEMTTDAIAVARPTVSRQVVELVGRVDEPTDIVVSADEIASLLGATAADVEGATVRFTSGGLTGARAVIENGEARATVTPKAARVLPIHPEVDLATAANPAVGPGPDEDVRGHLRLLRVAPGPAVQATLTGPAYTPSGAPATLQVRVSDAHYNTVAEAGQARFYRGDSLQGEVTLLDGVASTVVTPVVVTPRLDRAEATTVIIGDDESEGVALIGTGFSRNAMVTKDGQPLSEEQYQVVASTRILIVATSHEGQWTVENPAP